MKPSTLIDGMFNVYGYDSGEVVVNKLLEDISMPVLLLSKNYLNLKRHIIHKKPRKRRFLFFPITVSPYGTAELFYVIRISYRE